MTDGNVLRVANCSGFYGDKLSAAREMVEGGPIDVLTGDYLAELTMAILYNQQQQRGGNAGYVGTFLKQIREVVGPCAEKGIKIVSNAGGLNPAGMAEDVRGILDELGVDARVAYIDGDDLAPRMEALGAAGESFTNMDKGIPLTESGNEVLTANAYFGAWGIKEALDKGADIVICPRVTDAAVVIGPAAWKFNWQRNDFDALAGALTAGHIIECGCQACGGNYSFFTEVPSFRNVGYPIAEIEADGSFTITKHPGTGGLVSVGTVTAQLLYEISTPAYVNPDVIAHFDSLSIEQAGDDRVRVSGVRGSNPPPTHKVCINTARRLQKRHGDPADRTGHRGEGGGVSGYLLRFPGRPGAVRQGRDPAHSHRQPQERRSPGEPADPRALQRSEQGGPAVLGQDDRAGAGQLPGFQRPWWHGLWRSGAR
jgi:hypothetical protein